MSEPLTTEHFDEIITALHGDMDKRFDKLDERLGAIEVMLWQGQRLDEHERRIIKLAETVGRPDLATPVTRPIGS